MQISSGSRPARFRLASERRLPERLHPELPGGTIGHRARGSGVRTAATRDIRSARPYFLTRHPAKAFVRRAGSILALVSLDVCGLALGLYGALALREVYHGNVPPLWGLLWEAEKTWLPFLTLVLALVFWRNSLYERREQRAGFGSILASLIVVGLITLAFAIGAGHEFSTYGLVPTAVVLTAGLIGLLRASYGSATSALFRLGGVRRRALLVGEASELEHLYRAFGSTAGIEYEFVGAVAGSAKGLPVARLGSLSDLPRILYEHPVDELIVADSRLANERLLQIVEEALREGVKVRVAPQTTEILAQRARYIPGQGVPLFELRPPVFAGVDWVIKRGFDLVVSALLVVGGLPLWILIALAVKLTSPGPVFYRDRRVGVGEREFFMLKFRTMYSDAPERQAELESANEADGALFKLRSDPRVTPVGGFLRRFSLDEFPQVLNVLRGEMSLVGPRPLPLRDYRLLEPWHRRRYLVLPGMTGLWQTAGRSNLGFDDLVRLDFYYVENWSVWLDVSIILRTVPVILTRRGAY
jgi:exopolysaccharide biosynthesis polyprenyl glycosylphosphotransferase